MVGLTPAGPPDSLTGTPPTGPSPTAGPPARFPPDRAASGAPASRRGLRARHPTGAFVLRRIAAGLGTLLALSVLVFAATNVLPGNAAELTLGRNATPPALHKLERRLGFDHSIEHRYISWLGGLLHGDLGNSAVAVAQNSPEPSIAHAISTPLKNSAVLALLTTVLLIPLTLLLGAFAGIHARRKVDHLISTPALVFAALPEFVTATLLIVVFFAWLGALPPVSLVPPGTGPLSNIEVLVLPVLTLLLASLAAGIRQVRSGVIEVLQEDYVHVAQLNGLRGRTLLWGYVLRNALAPSVQIVAQTVQYLVGGIIVVESVFSYPGIGTYLVQAVSERDVTAVQSTVIVLAAVYILINLLADLLVVFLVPKLRTELA